MPLRAVIFDLDGTLIDTESLWDVAMTGLLKEKYGKEFDPHSKSLMMGVPGKESTEIFMGLYGLTGNVDEIKDLRKSYYIGTREQLGVKPMPGADALLKNLHAAGIPMAIATSESRKRTEETVERLGWKDFFSVIVVSEEVKHGKPAPDIFLEAARQLKCRPEDCVAVEDAPAGVESAKAAGMKVLGVRDARYQTDLSKADRVVDTLEGIRIKDFEKIVALPKG